MHRNKSRRPHTKPLAMIISGGVELQMSYKGDVYFFT